MQSVQYSNSSDNPSTQIRTVSFTLSDTTDSSTTVTRQISVTAENDAPTLTGIEGTVLSYTENDVALDITSTLSTGDADDTHLDQAVVEVTTNYVNGEDVLSFTDAGGVSGVWDAANGRMTLSGNATVAQYQTALQAVQYSNTSDNPST